jgi:hypothetical protein
MKKTLTTACAGAALAVSLAACSSAGSVPLGGGASSLIYGTATPSAPAASAASQTPGDVNPTITVSCKMVTGPADTENDNKPAWWPVIAIKNTGTVPADIAGGDFDVKFTDAAGSVVDEDDQFSGSPGGVTVDPGGTATETPGSSPGYPSDDENDSSSNTSGQPVTGCTAVTENTVTEGSENGSFGAPLETQAPTYPGMNVSDVQALGTAIGCASTQSDFSTQGIGQMEDCYLPGGHLIYLYYIQTPANVSNAVGYFQADNANACYVLGPDWAVQDGPNTSYTSAPCQQVQSKVGGNLGS